ncbi:MAG: hypothetical protein PHV52_06355 [Aliarcobacter sp.]|nr:hypothetical protein [Aliarcobacter sp.]
MSINPNMQLVPFTNVKMLNETIKLIGMPRLNAQIIITLPNINEFNEELKNSINHSKNEIECFIITTSSKNEIENIIKEFDLNESIISNDFRSFAKTFNLDDKENKLIKSLIMVNKDCQIIHKEIL